jgi:hypothetical protein
MEGQNVSRVWGAAAPAKRLPSLWVQRPPSSTENTPSSEIVATGSSNKVGMNFPGRGIMRCGNEPQAAVGAGAGVEMSWHFPRTGESPPIASGHHERHSVISVRRCLRSHTTPERTLVRVKRFVQLLEAWDWATFSSPEAGLSIR